MADASPALEAVRFETADQVATITLNRPQALNAFDRAMKTELLARLRSVERDTSVRAVVLTGEGRAFCAGQDLREPFGGEHPTLADELRLRYNPVILAIVRLAKPVIAAVNGVAAGAGCSLALACDLRVATEGASFVLAFGRVGLVPDSGATWFLPRIVGQARAAELALLGDPVSAEEAARIGLVNRVVPAESLLDEARALASRLAEGSPLAMGLTKRALRYGAHASLEAALEHEAALQGIAGRSRDHEEGVAAFRAKRAARFTGD
jgi:2-(1,2-epoxy-1,2-dihydrophenyl)acetyl-CoA isomerase